MPAVSHRKGSKQHLEARRAKVDLARMNQLTRQGPIHDDGRGCTGECQHRLEVRMFEVGRRRCFETGTRMKVTGCQGELDQTEPACTAETIDQGSQEVASIG